MGVRVAVVGLGDIGFRLAELLRDGGGQADRCGSGSAPHRASGARTRHQLCHHRGDHSSGYRCAGAHGSQGRNRRPGILSHLRCKIVAGAVDDPLCSPALGQVLHDRGILFLPDTVINAGGLISLVQPLLRGEAAASPLDQQLQAIGDRIAAVIDRAETENLPTSVIAERMAKEALELRASPRALAS